MEKIRMSSLYGEMAEPIKAPPEIACEHGYYPYCPTCPFGGESITDSELEALAAFGECNTTWYCTLDK